jgi:phage replication O-like protein O
MSDRPLIPNFTPVPNVVLEKLMPGLSKAALKVLLAVARKTYGFHKDRDAISLTQLQKLTGRGRAGVVRGINELGSLMNVTKGANRDCNVYELNIDISTSELVSEWNWFQNGTSSKTVKKVVPKWNTQNKEDKRKNTSDSLFPIIQKIISRINELNGRNYRADSKAVCKYLRARLEAGATEADCLAVVEDRFRRWGNDEKMSQHFNPVTPFRQEKFELYLAEANANGSGNAINSDDWRKETFINA